MSALEWFPEEVPPWGAFTARGLRGVLGRPGGLHPLTILVRETAQNSWDARLGRGPVRFSLDGMDLSDKQLKRLREEVFAHRPPHGLPLGERLVPGLRALIIRDTNTHGLGGPTRADRAQEGLPNRYIRLLLDIGVARRAELGGGTYGFGRSSAYNLSGARTVLVYTRTTEQLNKPESRFVVAAMGDDYTYRGNRFTGRHWWGRIVRNSVEPVVGTRADSLAAGLGFTRFGADETGTALMILDPTFRTADPERAMAYMAESITWHLWPKMVTTRGRKPMRFTVSWNGNAIPVPDPGRTQPLPGYVRALEVLKEAQEEGTSADGVEVIEIRAERPKATLGQLAVIKFPFRNRRPATNLGEDEDPRIRTATPFEEQSRHVVLLRKPELVVTYQEYAALPDGNLEWAGVFLADEKHNEAFAAAEPPAHDGWEPATVEDRSQRRIVNIALRGIREAVNTRHRGRIVDGTGGDAVSVARVANALGPLFSGIPGTGSATVAIGTPPGPRPPGSRRPTVKIARSGLASEAGERRTEVEFSISGAKPGEPLEVRIAVDVATGDGSTVEGDDQPAGAPVPVLLAVEGPTDVPVVEGSREVRFEIADTGETKWRVLGTAPDDLVVSFSIDADYATEAAT